MRSCSAKRTYRFGLIVATLSALFAMALCGSQVSAAIYYVRAGGNNSNNGSTPATAFRTMDKASTVVASGDTVYVGAGTYLDSVVLDGVQQSTAPLAFIADIDGAFTGDAGPIIISNKMIAVVNCNFVEFHDFQFQNASVRPVVWKGSYDGLFKDCTFTGGNEPLLIKDGSVTIEDCQLTDFATDAIYVDGEAVVQLVNSSISDCGGEGIEITKTARVVLDGTTVENNVGDGIKFAETETYIDDGGVGASGGITERLVAGKFRIIASMGMVDGYDSTVGPYGAGNSLQDVDLYGNSLVSAGSSVPVYGDVHYAPGGSASVPNLTGTISQMSSSITMDPIDVGDAATNNDNGSIPLTSLGRNPYVSGNLYLSAGETLDLPPGTYYFTQVAITTGAALNITGPTTIYVTYRVTLSGGSIANPTQKPGDLKFLVTGSLVTLSGSSALYAAIYAPDARVSLSGSTALYGMVAANEIIANSTGGIHLDKSLATYAAEVQGLSTGSSSPAPPPGWTTLTEGELDASDSTIQGNRRAVTIETNQRFTATDANFLNNTEWGVSLNGPFDLDTCTITGNGIGGIWMKDINDGDFSCTQLTIGDNPEYGVYLEDCQVTFDGLMLDPLTFTSSSDYILAAQGGSLTVDGVTISGGTVAGVYASAGALVVRNATVTGSGYGVGADQSTLTVENCTLTGNATGLYSQQNTALNVTGTTLSTNSAWGAAVSLTSVMNATATFSGSTLGGNAGGIAFVDAANNCTITLPNTVIDGNTGEGLRFENSSLTLTAAAATGLQIENNSYGINSVNSTLTLDGLTLSGNSAAALLATGGNLTVSNSTLTSGGYGVSVVNSGTVSIDTCNLSGTTAAMNADQNADVTVTSSNLTGSPYGLWATNNTLLVADSSTFSGNSLYGVYLEGNGSLHDCTITSNTSGLYLNAVNATDANLSGTDIFGNTTYGVYVHQGSLALATQATDGWSIDSNGYNLASYQASISLTAATLTSATSYGLHAQYGSVNLQQSTIRSNWCGVSCSNADSFVIDRSQISGSGTGTWTVINSNSGLTMRNTIVSGGQNGVYSDCVSKDTTIYNTTIADASQYGLYVQHGDVTLMNTIISGTSGAVGLSRQPSATVTHTYNLVYGFTTPFENTTADATELLDQPRFTDAANGDYSLAKGSPAINSGADLSLSHTVDMVGNVRPSRKVFEIGAYEYVQDGGSLRVLKWKEDR